MPSQAEMQQIREALLGVVLGPEKVHVADVERHGEKIILPKGMKTKDAIVALQRQEKYDNEVVQLDFEFPYFVWDGAYALAKVMQEKYGFVFGETQYSFFGKQPPQLIGIETELGKVEQIAWGKFSVPGIEDGFFTTGYTMKEGRLLFKFSATVKHMYEEEIKALRDKVAEFLEKHSIYKGKAISVRFTDDKGKKLLENGEVPTPKFIDVSKAREQELVFPAEVDDAVKTNLFTPIERLQECREAGIPIKRGILLAGPYGVGKTLTAYIAAQKAVKSGITYVYCQNPQEFPDVMRFAAQYAPSLVFCEDVDRIVPLDRDKSVDELINIVDGVETKNSEIITVFTTNEVRNVNRALLRPGRMDAVIPVHKPDAVAVQKLIVNYAGKYLSKDADLTEVGEILKDNIPAVVREVCERAKLAAFKLLPKGERLKQIPVSALKEAATTMRMQLELLSNQDRTPKEDDVLAVEMVAGAIREVAKSLKPNGHVSDLKVTPAVVTPKASATSV